MKTVLVTGGARGIGAEIAKIFAQNGYSVIINYNSSFESAQNLCAEIVKNGGDAHIYKADLRNAYEIKSMFDYILTYFKKLDVLVNNAGVSYTGTIDCLSDEEVKNIFSVNAVAPYFCCKYALPLLKKSPKSSVVNISSIWGINGASCEAAYSMTKHAIVGLTKSLAKEWSLIPINVNCVCPPFVFTSMTKGYSQKEVDDFCKETGTHAYNPCDVAKDVYKLALSNKSGVILIEK